MWYWKEKLFEQNDQKSIKKIRIKIKIKNKNNILIEGWNSKEKSIQQKTQK